ncbi:hypothetical protein BDN72DRAFT_842359 [Pluteus cervinus]|uniref:Uncharacterized protein n=1 Tax=Pluteus cervinus TaxID=181527 RepID=A0ACD3AQM8_9AGAR|nr:hypothetical protein BDN72DRAFT_842359 [Pluteus cervinus]
MFKKPLGNLKTSAPLRSSDRRKLKQRAVTAFNLTSEEGDLLVPDGILSIKFSTHLNELGTAYLNPGQGGDPLWFTIGKGSEDLIPTIYTLWKHPTLLPFVSTPPAVIPVLVGGADLMVPGVVHHSPSLTENQLVSICQYNYDQENPTLSAPLAVGRMAVSGQKLESAERVKGKAVHVYHTWKDHLWTMGSTSDPPGPQPLRPRSSEDPVSDAGAPLGAQVGPEQEAATPPPPTSPEHSEHNEPPDAGEVAEPVVGKPQPSRPQYTPQQISDLLHASLLQAIATILPSIQFPLSSTQVYSGYVLPARPAFPTSIIPLPGPAPYDDEGASSLSSPPDQEISIKTSSHKSLTAFLKASEKAGLLTLKGAQKHSQQSELIVISINASHPLVKSHKKYVTVKDIEEKAAKKAQREDEQKQAASGGKLEIRELWKPHLVSANLFKEMGASTSELYTVPQVKTLLTSYIHSKSLMNPNDQAYINLDEALQACLSATPQRKSKNGEGEPASPTPGFMKREELISRVIAKMQAWHEVSADGRDPICKKGGLQPVQVVMKLRQGRKASTLITGFEPYLVIDAEEMAEELRKICAGATSVTPLPGKGAGFEVFVQGKQSQAVVTYLQERGIPKQWVSVQDLIKGKK